MLFLFCIHVVPAPIIHHSPGGIRHHYYTGENLNLSCISSVMGAVFIWRGINTLTKEPFFLPNTSINNQASTIVFKPLTYTNTSFNATCEVTISAAENRNVTTGVTSTYVVVKGMLCTAMVLD